MYVGHTEIEVCGVAQDETTAEEKSYGENRTHEHILRKVHLLRAIDKVRRPFQYACADCLQRKICSRSYAKQGCWLEYTYGKAKVESDEKNGVLEVEGVVQIIVVDDDA